MDCCLGWSRRKRLIADCSQVGSEESGIQSLGVNWDAFDLDLENFLDQIGQGPGFTFCGVADLHKGIGNTSKNLCRMKGS